jgi:hypothetical protein
MLCDLVHVWCTEEEQIKSKLYLTQLYNMIQGIIVLLGV